MDQSGMGDIDLRQAPSIPNLRRCGKRPVRLLHAVFISSAAEVGLRQEAERKTEIASMPKPVKRYETFLQTLHALCDIFSLTDSPAKAY